MKIKNIVTLLPAPVMMFTLAAYRLKSGGIYV